MVKGMGLGNVGFDLRLPPELLLPRQGYEISVHLPGSPYVLELAVRIVR